MTTLVDSRLDPQISNPRLAYAPARNLVIKGQQVHVSLSGNAHVHGVISEVHDVPTGACEVQFDVSTVEHPTSGRWSAQCVYGTAGSGIFVWHFPDEG